MARLRNIPLLLAVLFTSVAVGACGVASNSVRNTPQSTTSTTDCRTIEHQMGETEICGRPQRIVALGPNMLELLLSLNMQPAGFGDRFLFDRGDYDNPAQQIPYLGKQVTSQPMNVGLAFSPSLEALLEIKPDLILGSEANQSQYEALSKIAPTLLLEWFETEDNLQTIAKAIGDPERAEQLLAETKQRVAAAREKFASVVAARPKVLMLVSDPQLTRNILITSRNSFCGSLVADLGFKLVHPPGLTQSALSQQTQISLETLPQLNEADLIILLGYNDRVNQLANMNNFEQHQLNPLQQQWQKNAIAQSLDASKAGRVYFIPAYACIGLPGPIGTELYLEKLEEQLLHSQ